MSLARTQSRRRVLRPLAVAALVGASLAAAVPSIAGAGSVALHPSGEPCDAAAAGVVYFIPPDAPFFGSGVLDFSEPCGFALFYGPPSVGTFIGLPDGTFTYTPPPGFLGSAFVPFGFVGTDETAEIELVVEEPPCEVDVIDDAYETTEGVALSVGAPGVAANDDLCGFSVGFAATSSPSNGTLSFNFDGSFVYTPNAGFVGVDSFQYTNDFGSQGLRSTYGFRAPTGPPPTDDPATVTIDVAAAPTTTTTSTEPPTTTTEPIATTSPPTTLPATTVPAPVPTDSPVTGVTLPATH